MNHLLRQRLKKDLHVSVPLDLQDFGKTTKKLPTIKTETHYEQVRVSDELYK